MLDRDAAISTVLTVTPGQSVSVTGDTSFVPVPSGPWSAHSDWNMRDAPLWGTGSFAVHERGSLALTRIALDPAASITVSGGSLSLASMIVPEAALTTSYSAASTLRLADVAVAEYRSDDTCEMANDWGCYDGGPNQSQDIPVGCTLGTDATDCGTPPAPPPLTGKMESTADDQGHVSWAAEGSLSFGSPVFSVTSGPCTVSEGGRCVGRAEGYGPSEECAIVVGGTGGGVLAPCAVFDLYGGDSGDIVTLPGVRALYGSECPVGAGLAAGDALSWTSDGRYQGGGGNGCGAKGTCGLPYSTWDVGGGWKLCFA